MPDQGELAQAAQDFRRLEGVDFMALPGNYLLVSTPEDGPDAWSPAATWIGGIAFHEGGTTAEVEGVVKEIHRLEANEGAQRLLARFAMEEHDG